MTKRTQIFILVFTLVLGLWCGVATAQDEEPTTEEEPTEETGSSTGWRPSGGSLFGGNRARPTTTTGTSTSDPLNERPVLPSAEEIDDDRPEVLIFDLWYEDGIRFSDGYLRRFEEAFEEAVEENEIYRPLRGLERSRRLTAASQLVTSNISAEHAEEIAISIEADYFIVPRVEIENSRNYRVTVTLGRAGEGEDGYQVHTRTSNRVVDNVESRIGSLTEDALAPPSTE